MTLDRLEKISHYGPVTLPTLENPDNYPYYHFLYHLAKDMGPVKILEIGTDKGDSAAWMGASRADTKVITVDVATSPVIFHRIAPFPNVKFWHRNTNDMALPGDLRFAMGEFDIIFQDGEHSGSQVQGEHVNYLPLLRSGGLLIMDDIRLDDNGIQQVWEAIAWPKIELPHLHNTSFGVAIKP